MERIGICKICKEEKNLTYEHFPPRSAFNKTTRFYKIKSSDYYQNYNEYSKSKKIKSKLHQGGLGEYCLCETCNNFLGTNYVNDYVNFAKICFSILHNNQEVYKAVEFKLEKKQVNLKYFLKQATSIFICNNDEWFTKTYPELLDFVKDIESDYLPEKFRFYLYLNDEGQIRNGNWNITNIYGETCEFTYPPFGIILSINNPDRLIEVSEITLFKYYDKFQDDDLEIILNKYPTYSQIPLDFREPS